MGDSSLAEENQDNKQGNLMTFEVIKLCDLTILKLFSNNSFLVASRSSVDMAGIVFSFLEKVELIRGYLAYLNKHETSPR